MAKQTITPGSAPIVWSTVNDAFEKINANFTELYASVGGAGIEFDALESNLTPAQNDTFDLGAPNKRWANVYISDTLSIGGASITNEGLTVNLPSGTTVAGQLIIDPDKSFFKEFSVNSETSVVADQFNDTLDFNAGDGVELTVNSTNDQITITNSGVTSLTAGSGMSVSGSTGSVTVTNAGVRSAVAGLGIGVSAATGAVTFSNSGIVEIESGNITSLTVSARDPVTGKVIITNTAPAGNAYRIVSVLNSVGSIENTLNANSTGATIQLQEGTGINLVGTTTPNKVVFENTGVLSLTGGNGITVSSSTGNITVSIGRGDLIGSVFADDSTMLVDGTNGIIRGNVENTLTKSGSFSSRSDVPIAVITTDNSLYATGNGVQINPAGTNSTIQLIGTTTTIQQSGSFSDPYIQFSSGVLQANAGAKFAGVFDGELTGSVFSDNSTMLVDGVDGKIVGPVDTNTVAASTYIQTGVYADLTAIAAAIPTAVKGMIVFDDGTNQFRGFDGSSWVALN